MYSVKWILAVIAIAVLFIGCEVTPYKYIFKTEAGAEIEMQCALVGGIPVMCTFYQETRVEVPVEVLVGVVVEKVVEVEKIVEVEKVVEVEKIVEVERIVEIETIVESITTEYINTEIDVDAFVQSVIVALPAGTTLQNYDYQEVVAAVEETIVTYTPEPTTEIKTTTITHEPTYTPPIVPEPTIITQQPVYTPPPKPTDPPPPITTPDPVVIDNTPKRIRVDGGNTGNLGADQPIVLTIRTGEHDPFQCEGKHPSVIAYKDGAVRDHQHWGACETDGEIVVYLKDHPALTCAVGPNRHELEIEGLNERVVVEEGCE